MKEALEKFNELIYSVAPGFVALVALLVADQNNHLGVYHLIAAGAEWRFAVVGILLGLLSYSFHLAALEDIMMRAVIAHLRWHHRKDIPTKLKRDEDEQKLKPVSEIIQILTRERWNRSASPDHYLAAAQSALDETYLWIFFLYCSAYLLIVEGVILLCRMHFQFGNWVWLLAGGALFLLVAIWGDIKTTHHEMKLMQNQKP